ncbi:MAG: UDP-N-acetylmuramoyl-tripeptide--D-alanyl-D-alanine ligase [Deltaproteobacteria bacterium]|nr:UDP-N-acetylmuramoyl-tripeptide--D-alanyl-D-alanine ligase [Deltaproteobacteria bacterium]
MSHKTAKQAPKPRPLSWACAAMGGTMLVPAAQPGATFAGAATDSREVRPGRLFFALPGERVDGFDFCAEAVRAGAAAVVVAAARGQPAGCASVPVIAVPDPRRALGDLARAVRSRFRGRVIGVTGSNGKTTTKELIAAALSASGTVLRTQGNLNTDVGMPLTVIESTEQEDFWVLEMAMRARGEIAYLANVGKPHVGVVTNVAGAHLERLGSVDAVARAKGEIFRGLARGGIAVLPAGEPRLEREADHLAAGRKLRFAVFGGEPATVRVLDLVPAGQDGSVVRLAVDKTPLVLRLPLAGEHNAANAAAALAVVRALSLPLVPAAKAMAAAVLPPHRSQVLAEAGRTIMDDCYNANPTSMRAALRTVVAAAGASARAFAILGDMLELGPEAAQAHEALGAEAARLGYAGLAAVGEMAARIVDGARAAGLPRSRVLATLDPELAAAAMAQWSKPGDWVLVKASRGMRLERALEALRRKLEG